MSGKTIIMRMEVRDADTWTPDKTVSVAISGKVLDASSIPSEIVALHAKQMLEALKRLG